jgi:myo-inositol-1(or 4)-monophosphatase
MNQLGAREIDRYLAFMRPMAHRAGKLLKEGFRKRLSITYKGRINPVTDVDLGCERLITGAILKKYPGHAVLGEEGSDSRGHSEFIWIIDPLDGTVNYAHGFPVYCVSIGLEYQKRIVAGVVYDPERDELFWSGTGLPAYLNRKRMAVTTERRLDRALLATGFAYDIGSARKNNLGYFARMAKRAQGIRRPGSAAIDLCWLAAGRIDGFWELKLHPWDTAAASLIVRQAGGTTTRVDGSEYCIFDPDLLASNGYIHKSMMAALAGK